MMNIVEDTIYGYIAGDVYGLSILKNNKFGNKITIKKNNELNIEKGSFSSLTSFLLATMDSISKNNDISIIDILNKMCTCLILGKYTNNGKIYDIDNYTMSVLKHYSIKNNLDNIDLENNLETYCFSRVVPYTLYSLKQEENFDNFLKLILITNTNELVILGAYIYYKYLLNLINTHDKYKSLHITFPAYFKKDTINKYKNILKGNINYNNLKYDNDVISILNIVFYVILNSNSFIDMFNFIGNLDGKRNIYSSLICTVGGILYGKKALPKNIINNISNKRDINKFINEFEKSIN